MYCTCKQDTVGSNPEAVHFSLEKDRWADSGVVVLYLSLLIFMYTCLPKLWSLFMSVTIIQNPHSHRHIHLYIYTCYVYEYVACFNVQY